MPIPAARRLWWAIEPFYGVGFFSAEIAEMHERLGILDEQVGAIALRSAPLGRVPAATVGAAVGGFAPRSISAAIPLAWSVIAPDALLVRRLHAVDQAMWRLLGNDLIRSNDLVVASQLARRAAEHADCSARVLAASCQALDWPTFPHLLLWHAVSVLREHRQGGLAAAHMFAGLSGCEPQILMVAGGESDAALVRDARGWSESEWTSSVEGLADRGLLTKVGGLTDDGRSLVREIEAQTDELASQPLEVLDNDEQRRLQESLGAFSTRVVDAGDFSYPNEFGVPALDASRSVVAADGQDDGEEEQPDVGHADDGEDQEAADGGDGEEVADAPDDDDGDPTESDRKPSAGDGGRKGGKSRARRGSRS